MTACPWRRVWRTPVRLRRGHNWDDRAFPRDDKAGEVDALGVPWSVIAALREREQTKIISHSGGVTSLETLWEPREVRWSRAILGRQKLAGKRKTLAGSFA
jgi:hypothetical protein